MSADGVAIVVLTYGRLHLFRQCVENVLARTSSATREIVIWNNGATDGTKEFLDSLQDPRLRVIHHPENIGQNAYPDAVALTTAPYVIELDDDVIDAPVDWDLTLVRAFQRLPDVGFLASGLVDHPHDLAARAMYHAYKYTEVEEAGMKLLLGPTGGGCSVTSRDLYDRVGGFPREPGQVFFPEDGGYATKVRAAGYRTATLVDLKVLHAGGPYFSEQPAEKIEYYQRFHRRNTRKNGIKRFLLDIPGVARLNARHGWFQPPVAYDEFAHVWLDLARHGAEGAWSDS